MRTRKLVFCEFGFLLSFIEMQPSMLEPNDESINRMFNWVSLYKFISKSDIFLDVSDRVFKEKVESYQWLKQLWKKATAGECSINCAYGKFPSFESIASSTITSEALLNAVYLTVNDTEKCLRIGRNLGVLVINPNLVFESQHLYKDNGTAFPSPNAQKWNFMSPLSSMCLGINVSNTMLIVDPYLLRDNKNDGPTYQDKVDWNLKPILKELLPQKLTNDIVYHIYIFSGDKDDGFDIYTQYNYVKNVITSIRKELNFTLTIFYKCENFHDRSIITNNVFISCGLGFDVFNKKGVARKSTMVSIIYPYLQSNLEWGDASYSNLLKDVRKVFENRLNNEYNCIGESSSTCRLFDKYEIADNRSERSGEIENENFTTIIIPHSNVKIVDKIDLSKFDSRNGKRRW